METSDNISVNTKRPLRVAIVTETYPPEINGVALTMVHFAQGLLARGHNIQLVRPRQHPQDTPENKAYFSELLSPGLPLPRYSGLKLGLPIIRTLKRAWKKTPPDIVHIATEGPLGWAALHVARKLALPVSSDFHTNFHSYSRYYGLAWLYRPINLYLRYFHNRAQGTFVPSTDIRDQLATMGYRNLHIVGRGVDIELFNPNKRSAVLRNTWGVREQDPVVLYVGRLAAEKNLDLLFTAFDAMQRVQPRAKLVLVGDGPLFESLRARHPTYIFAGLRRGEDLAQYYASADIFLFPSTTETFGNVTVEAMASGLTVLAYDYAAAAQHIRHRENGLLAPFNDAGGFVDAAVGLINDGPLLAYTRIRARETIASFSWASVLGTFEQMLYQIIYEYRTASTPSRIPVEQI